MGKHNPKGFWKELQQKRKQIENNIIEVQWVEYAKLLYEQTNEKCKPPTIDTLVELFLVTYIKQGIRNLESGKARYIKQNF